MDINYLQTQWNKDIAIRLLTITFDLTFSPFVRKDESSRKYLHCLQHSLPYLHVPMDDFSNLRFVFIIVFLTVVDTEQNIEKWEFMYLSKSSVWKKELV